MFNVCGIEFVDYISKNSNHVCGAIIYFTSPISEDKGLGMKADSVFANRDIYLDISIGDNIEIYYNKFGKPIKIEKV